MSLSPFLVIPGLTCLFWALAHSLLARRTATHRILMTLLLTLFLTAAGDVMIGTLMQSEAVAHAVVQLFAPAALPLSCMYFAQLYRQDSKFQSLELLWTALPVMLFTADIILISMNGLEATDALQKRLHAKGLPEEQLFRNNIEHAYYVWTVIIFRLVMIAEIVYALSFCALQASRLHFRLSNLSGFFFRGRSIRALELQMNIALLVIIILMAKLFIHKTISFLYPGWSLVFALLLSVLYFFFGYFALFGAREFITLKDLFTAIRFNYTPATQARVAEDVILDMSDSLSGESLTHVITRLDTQVGGVLEGGTGRPDAPSLASAIFTAVSKSWEENSLLTRFQHLMLDEELFLHPGLTLADVADRLDTNKTYVSKMVNETYNLGFPEVLNILRVDYAQKYIRDHADASQEAIAKACGFLSAPSFNSTFKRITGYTPKVWAARKASSTGH